MSIKLKILVFTAVAGADLNEKLQKLIKQRIGRGLAIGKYYMEFFAKSERTENVKGRQTFPPK